MSSVIITKGAINIDDPLVSKADQSSFKIGMRRFGKVLEDTYKKKAAPGDLVPEDKRVEALVETFKAVIGETVSVNTGYYAYFIRNNGKAFKIYSPTLLKRKRKKIKYIDDAGNEVEIDPPAEDAFKYVVSFDYKKRNGSAAVFRIIAKPDFEKKMHVSLPGQRELETYLGVTAKQFEALGVPGTNMGRKRRFLLANVLLSRCK